MKKTSLIFSAFLLISLLFAGLKSATAANSPILLYDTSNNYLGACGLTDTTEWTLDKDLDVSLFQIWYNWDVNETNVNFTLKKDGKSFLSGTVDRTNCDPYQSNWCNGDLEVSKVFPKGTYDLKVAVSKQCAIPSGNGTVRLYGAEDAAAVEEAPNTTAPTDDTKDSDCDCASAESLSEDKDSSIPTWSYFAFGGSLLLNVGLIIFLFKKQ